MAYRMPAADAAERSVGTSIRSFSVVFLVEAMALKFIYKAIVEEWQVE
jgi:hypothetical protein